MEIGTKRETRLRFSGKNLPFVAVGGCLENGCGEDGDEVHCRPEDNSLNDSAKGEMVTIS